MRRAEAAMGAFRAVLGVGLVAALGAATPACFFPEFTFGEGGGGSGGSPTTTSEGGGTTTSSTTTTSQSTTTTDGGGGTMTTSSTEGGGGTMTTSSTEGGGGTGGTGGMTGGGGTGGTTTTSTTTTTPPPVENCTNGVDDDADGLADCKDTEDCADYTCVGSIPQGWTGYFFLYDGMLAADPGCVEDAPTPSYVGSNNLNAPPAQCATCSCSAPQGETCVPSQTFTVADAPCGQQPFYTGPTNMPGGWTGTCAHHLNSMGNPTVWSADNLCGPDDMQQCNVSISGAGPAVQGGFCTSSAQGMNSVPTAEWQGFGRACGDVPTTGGGCNLTQKCVPKPPVPYVGGICIKKNANNAATQCPSGVSLFKNLHTFYESFTDSRMCTGCSCGPDLGATCAGTYSVFSDLQVNTCNQFVTTWTAGTCVNLPGNPIVGPFLFNMTSPPSGGSCQPQGGMAVGQATPTFPTMFCCTD